MRASDLRPVPGSTHKRKRVGRGNASGHGTYSGRGLKGQKSRSGRDLRIGFEGGQNPLIRALSRKRGFKNRFRTEYEAINVAKLEGFEKGATITPESLRAAGIVKSARLPVKILGSGELKVALTVEADRVSASARAKIEAAGGSVIERMPRPEPKEPKERRAKPKAAESEDEDASTAEAPAPQDEGATETKEGGAEEEA